MFKSIFSIFIFIGILLGLPACGPKYHKRPLIPLNRRTADFEETRNDVTLRARKLDRDDADYIFDGRGHTLLKGRNPIYPIQISIFNQSKKTFMISHENIDVRQVHLKTIEHMLRTSTFGEAFITYLKGFGIGLAVGIPVALVGAPQLGSAIASLGSTAGIIGGAAAGVSSSHANDALLEDLLEKSLVYPVVISPFQYRDFIIFVDKASFEQHFNVELINHNYPQDVLEIPVILRPTYLPSNTQGY